MAIDPVSQAYVLEGRLVTMGGRGVVDQGRLYIEGGRIRFVRGSGEAVPAGFENAPTVATRGTIYPGLIELHNHLSYNAMPLWDVPEKYSNNGQWRGGDDYRRLITKPSQVLGQTDGVVQALVRLVECRALLGGVTTSQGITLASASGIVRYYKGLVRNVESPGVPGLPAAGTNIANPEPAGGAAYLAKLRTQSAYLQHLAEGSDDTARSWFQRLRFDGTWAITKALCGIHSAALRREDFDVLAANGASMVWSPLSNYLLYGSTADIEAVKAARLVVGLGSDWAPSGSKNLLGELKVAWLASQEHGSVFSPADLVAMVTSNPAKILGWNQHLGMLEDGKLADVTVIAGQTGDPYRHLIEATEPSVSLVVIGGVPRLGQRRLMHRFGTGSEELRIGGSDHVLELRDASLDPAVAAPSLGEAVATVRDAMARLPQVAAELDARLASGDVPGAADDAGDAWRIVPDFDEADAELDAEIAADTGFDVGAQPYAFWVRSMTLDPLTAADDRDHLRRLLAARNLPDFVKRGLPALFHQRVSSAPGGDVLTDPSDADWTEAAEGG
jgi:5-methylthioadenosine/S-adenosylhomocysteine deaminase